MAGELTITVQGNLTADPDLRFTADGTPVANFTIAQTPRIFDRQTGEWKDGATVFVRCTAWRALGEHIANSTRKGTRVLAAGDLVQRSYEKDGEKRTSIELTVADLGVSLQYAEAQVRKLTTQVDPRAAATTSEQTGTEVSA